MLYLVEKYDMQRKISYDLSDLPGHTEQLSWLFWQIGGLGPMQGESCSFIGQKKAWLRLADDD
jgi:glutathione S-transferase